MQINIRRRVSCLFIYKSEVLFRALHYNKIAHNMRVMVRPGAKIYRLCFRYDKTLDDRYFMRTIQTMSGVFESQMNQEQLRGVF